VVKKFIIIVIILFLSYAILMKIEEKRQNELRLLRQGQIDIEKNVFTLKWNLLLINIVGQR
jgi:hypothetical protein